MVNIATRIRTLGSKNGSSLTEFLACNRNGSFAVAVHSGWWSRDLFSGR